MLLLTLLQPAQALEIDTLIGFGQSTTAGAHYRPDTWTPLTVYLTGQGTRGTGQLQVSVKVGEHTTIYTRRVPLKDGQVNEAVNFAIQLHSLDPYNPYNGGANTEIAVQLLMDGRSLAGPQKVALPAAVSPETYNVLGLTRDGSGLNLLNKKKLGLVHRHFNPANINSMGGNFRQNNGEQFRDEINPNASLQVLYTDLRALPAQPQGYGMIDAIVLGDQPLDSLTEDQLDALRGYVRAGGLLIISGGGDMARLKSQFFQEMLPVVPENAIVVRDIPALEGRYKSPLRLAGGAALAQGTLKPDAASLLSANDYRVKAGMMFSPGRDWLIAQRPYGCGMVVFTAFDLFDPNIKGWQAAPALWRDLLRTGNNSVSARGVLAAAADNAQNGNLRLADSLAGKRATTAPPLFTIGLFCGTYLLLLVPVNYLVLKRIDRREMTWITAPILIAGFTIASYVIARQIKGGELTVNRAVVLETQANSDQVAGYAQMTVYSPRRASYDISFGNPEDPNNPYRELIPGEILAQPGQGLGQQLTVDTDQNGTTLRNTLIKLWDKRSFDTPVATTLGGRIDAVTTSVPGKSAVEVKLTNHTRMTLTDCALVGEGQTELGSIAPGETVTRQMKWNTQGGAFNVPVPVPATPGNSNADPQNRPIDTPEVTQARIANALLQTLSSGSENQYAYGQAVSPGYGRSVNAFVGRFIGPALDVRVDGRQTAGEEVNLVVAHLPLPANAPYALRAKTEPFARKPVLDLEDETPPGTRKLGVFR